MALTGEKVGIPSVDEAPMIVMARFKQPVAGILSIIIVFIISWITWLVFFDPRWHNPYPTQDMEITAWTTVIGGFGLIGVVWAIWFENWSKKFSQWMNFFFRFLLVILIGTISFLGYYLLSPIFFGNTTDFWRMNPTPFTLWFLWIEILFAYVWRKWPIYKAVG